MSCSRSRRGAVRSSGFRSSSLWLRLIDAILRNLRIEQLAAENPALPSRGPTTVATVVSTMFSFAAVAPLRDGTHGFVPTYWYRWLMPSDAGDDIVFVIGRLFVVAHDAGATRTAKLREPWPELVRVARDTPALRFRPGSAARATRQCSHPRRMTYAGEGAGIRATRIEGGSTKCPSQPDTWLASSRRQRVPNSRLVFRGGRRNSRKRTRAVGVKPVSPIGVDAKRRGLRPTSPCGQS
jgi:hypothetical protein